jgi:hypothetical protein
MKLANKLTSLHTASLIAISAMLGLSMSFAHAVDTGLDPSYSGLSRPLGSIVHAIGKGTPEVDEEKKKDGEEEDDQSTFLYPALGVGVTYDDNIYREEDGGSSAMIYRLRPELAIQGGKETTRMVAGYMGNYAVYSGGPNDDEDGFGDHKLYAGISGYGSRTSYGLDFNYIRGHDSIAGNGIGDNLESYDTWDQYALLGNINFGKPGARINLRLDGALSTREQDELLSINYNTQAIGALLGVRVGGKTRAVLEGGLRHYDYTNSTQSGDTYYARVGVTWEATAKTRGIVTYGRQEFKSDNPGTPIESDEFGPAFGINTDSSSSSWKGDISWEIRARDTLRFFTSRGTRVSSGTGTNKLTTSYAADWKHDWSERIRSNLGVIGGVDDYNGTPRSDDLLSYYLDASYKFRRNLLLRGNYNYQKRESNVDGNNYDRNRYFIGLQWEL